MEKNVGKRQKSVVVLWIPAIVWMGIIFLLSSRQSVTVSSEYLLNFLFFKTLHLIEYAILFILLVRATRSYRGAFILTILYAITDEMHQQFVPSRQGQPRDVIIDGVGAGLIWYCLLKLLPKAPPKLRNWAKHSGIPF